MISEIGFLEAVWPAPENIIAGTTLKLSGHSQGAYSAFNLGDHVGDNIDDVKKNRQLLIEALNLPSEPCWLDQCIALQSFQNQVMKGIYLEMRVLRVQQRKYVWYSQQIVCPF